jgi:hypothetical protein
MLFLLFQQFYFLKNQPLKARKDTKKENALLSSTAKIPKFEEFFGPFVSFVVKRKIVASFFEPLKRGRAGDMVNYEPVR